MWGGRELEEEVLGFGMYWLKLSFLLNRKAGSVSTTSTNLCH